jgi:uncharacterized protein YjbJ (UPF0337 family)
MVVAHSKVVGVEATRAASYFPDGQSARGTRQSGSILKEEDAMKPSTKDQAEGKFHEVKGKIKEKAGKATKNTNLENEGTNEKAAGKVQKKVGQVEKVLGD